MDPCDDGSCVEVTNGGTDNECLCAVGEGCVGDCTGDINTLSMGTQMCEGEKLVTIVLCGK